jgi:hypothetical protein
MDPFSTRCLACQRPAHDVSGLCRVCGGPTWVVFEPGEYSVIDKVDEARLDDELARGGALVAAGLPQERALDLASSFRDLRIDAAVIKGRPRRGQLFRNLLSPLPILAGIGVGAALIAVPGLIALDITGAGTATLIAALARGVMKKKPHASWEPAPPLPALVVDDVAAAKKLAPELDDENRIQLGRAISISVEILSRLEEDGLLAVTVKAGSSETIGESLEALVAEVVALGRQRVLAQGDTAMRLNENIKRLADAAQLAADEIRQTEKALLGQGDLFEEIADKLRLARETADELRELEAADPGLEKAP